MENKQNASRLVKFIILTSATLILAAATFLYFESSANSESTNSIVGPSSDFKTNHLEKTSTNHENTGKTDDFFGVSMSEDDSNTMALCTELLTLSSGKCPDDLFSKMHDILNKYDAGHNQEAVKKVRMSLMATQLIFLNIEFKYVIQACTCDDMSLFSKLYEKECKQFYDRCRKLTKFNCDSNFKTIVKKYAEFYRNSNFLKGVAKDANGKVPENELMAKACNIKASEIAITKELHDYVVSQSADTICGMVCGQVATTLPKDFSRVVMPQTKDAAIEASTNIFDEIFQSCKKTERGDWTWKSWMLPGAVGGWEKCSLNEINALIDAEHALLDCLQKFNHQFVAQRDLYTILLQNGFNALQGGNISKVTSSVRAAELFYTATYKALYE